MPTGMDAENAASPPSAMMHGPPNSKRQRNRLDGCGARGPRPPDPAASCSGKWGPEKSPPRNLVGSRSRKAQPAFRDSGYLGGGGRKEADALGNPRPEVFGLEGCARPECGGMGGWRGSRFLPGFVYLSVCDRSDGQPASRPFPSAFPRTVLATFRGTRLSSDRFHEFSILACRLPYSLPPDRPVPLRHVSGFPGLGLLRGLRRLGALRPVGDPESFDRGLSRTTLRDPRTSCLEQGYDEQSLGTPFLRGRRSGCRPTG